jgi:uncharacterized tellurite resistance protein B-like protein
MLESLKQLLSELSGGTKPQPHFRDDDYRLAAAALLIHVGTIDGDASPVAREKLRSVLQSNFALDEAATAELIERASAADRDAVDLYHFTSLLNRSLDEEGRRRIVEMMWQIIYADGRVSEFEDNVIWRAADLLGIASRERIEIGRRIAAERAASADPDDRSR